jgi:hypothetical protein
MARGFMQEALPKELLDEAEAGVACEVAAALPWLQAQNTCTTAMLLIARPEHGGCLGKHTMRQGRRCPRAL